MLTGERIAEQLTPQASDNNSLEEQNKRELRLLAGPIFRKYSLEFSQVILFVSHTILINLFPFPSPPKPFVLTIFPNVSVLLWLSFICLSHFGCRKRNKNPYLRIPLENTETLGPVKLRDNSVKFRTQVCEEMPADV